MKDLPQKIGSSILWNTILIPVFYILPLFTSVIIVRALDLETYGMFVLISGIGASLMLYTDLGLGKSTVKFFPEVRQKLKQPGLATMMFSTIMLKLGLSFLLGFVLILWPNILIDIFDFGAAGNLYVFFIVAQMIVNSINAVLTLFLIADLRNKALNIIEVVFQVIGPLSLVAVVLLGYGLTGLLVALVSVATLKSGVLLAAVQRVVDWKQVHYIKLQPLLRLLGWRYLKQTAMAYATKVVHFCSDIAFIALVLGIWGFKAELAYISIAFNLVKMTHKLLSSPAFRIKAPILATTFLDKSYRPLQSAYRSLLKLKILLIIPGSLGLFFAGIPLIGYLYGQEYMSADRYFWLIISGQLLYALLTPSHSILRIYEANKWFIVSVAVSLPTVLLLFIIPQHILSLLFVIIAMRVVFCGVSLIFAMHLYRLKFPISFLFKTVLASIGIMIAGQFIGPQTSLPGILNFMAIGGLSFWGLFKLQGGIDTTERKWIVRMKFPPKLERAFLHIL